jgi:Domain of unknown function (DUF4124)
MKTGMHRQMRNVLGLLPHALALFALFAFAAVSPAATYKWTDEDGKVHYSDKAPPEAPKGATVLDKQARPVKKIEAPLTSEQQKAKADEEERQKALAKARDDQQRKDRALMASYTSENEIDLARNRAVTTLEGQIRSAQTFTETLAKQQKALVARKESYAGKPLPVELEHEAASVDAEISRQNILIRQKQEELEMVAAKYDTIKQRWREILADKERAAAADRAAKPQATDPAPASGKAGATPMTTAGKAK